MSIPSQFDPLGASFQKFLGMILENGVLKGKMINLAKCGNFILNGESDFSGMVNANSCFSNRTNLIEVDDVVFPDATSADALFYGCTGLKTAKVTFLANTIQTNHMFQHCSNITSLEMNFPNATSLGRGYFLSSCSNLVNWTINCPKAISVPSDIFYSTTYRLSNLEGDLSNSTNFFTTHYSTLHYLTHVSVKLGKTRAVGFASVSHFDLESALFLFDQLIYGTSKASLTLGLNAYDQEFHPITGKPVTGCLTADGKRKYDFWNALEDFQNSKNYTVSCIFYDIIGASSTVEPTGDETFEEYQQRTAD